MLYTALRVRELIKICLPDTDNLQAELREELLYYFNGLFLYG